MAIILRSIALIALLSASGLDNLGRLHGADLAPVGEPASPAAVGPASQHSAPATWSAVSASQGCCLAADANCCIEECHPCSRCWLSADYLLLRRSAPRNNVFIIDNGGTENPAVAGDDTPLLTGDGLRPDAQSGWRFNAGACCDACSAFELSYFAINQWGTTRNFFSPIGQNRLQVPFDTDISTQFDSANLMSVSYNSRLHVGDVSYVRRYGDLEWLLGVCYVYEAEEFNLLAQDLSSPAVVGVGQYRITTRNNLFAAQVGARYWEPIGDRAGTVTTLKAALGANDARAHQFLADNLNSPQAVVIRDFHPQTTKTAFVGQLEVLFYWNVAGPVVLRAGYQLLWIEGLALAPEQFDTTTRPDSGSRINANGGLFVHGLVTGVGLCW